MKSACQSINEKEYRTWEQYRIGCICSFAAGLEGKNLGYYQSGMNTVFALLESEFPQPSEIFNKPLDDK